MICKRMLLPGLLSVAFMTSGAMAQRGSPRVSSAAGIEVDANGSTVILSGGDTDKTLELLDTHPEVKAIHFAGSMFSGSSPGGGVGHGFLPFTITDQGFAHIAKCRNLEELELPDRATMSLSDKALAALDNPKLRVVHLGQVGFSKEGLAPLTKLPALTDLYAPSCKRSDVIDTMLACPHLKVVRLASGPRELEITDDDVARLAPLVNLEEFRLDYSELTDKSLPVLARFQHLRILRISYAKITDEGFQKLASLTDLEELDLHGTKLTDASMKTIGGFKKLKSLDLGKVPISDAGVAELGELTHLKTLDLDGTQVQGKGLASLSKLQEIERLDLDSTPLTDEGLESMPLWPSLQYFSASNTKIGYLGVNHVKKLPNMKNFDW